jgi:Domain of unknown function (DUF4342)
MGPHTVLGTMLHVLEETVMSTPTQQPTPSGASDTGHKRATWTQNVDLVGDELVSFVKKLAADGKVSRIRIIEADGDIVIDMPLTLGAIAGGAVVLAAPMLAILGALAAFMTKVRLEIIRSGDAPRDHPAA